MPCALDPRDDSFLRLECARCVFKRREVHFLQPFNERNLAVAWISPLEPLFEVVELALGKGNVLVSSDSRYSLPPCRIRAW